jgi:hypothetical protein
MDFDRLARLEEKLDARADHESASADLSGFAGLWSASPRPFPRARST